MTKKAIDELVKRVDTLTAENNAFRKVIVEQEKKIVRAEKVISDQARIIEHLEGNIASAVHMLNAELPNV